MTTLEAIYQFAMDFELRIISLPGMFRPGHKGRYSNW
jgi:hypothetical protein